MKERDIYRQVEHVQVHRHDDLYLRASTAIDSKEFRLGSTCSMFLRHFPKMLYAGSITPESLLPVKSGDSNRGQNAKVVTTRPRAQEWMV